jgi:hypothetical protein
MALVVDTDEADEDSEKAGSFHKSADDDGRHPVMTGLLGLACAGLKRGGTDLSDTDGGSDGG